MDENRWKSLRSRLLVGLTSSLVMFVSGLAYAQNGVTVGEVVLDQE